MNFEDELRAHLIGDATLTALVGERIYPIVRKESSALPALTYLVVIDDAATGIAGFTSGLSNVRVQIEVIALGKIVRNRMFVAATNFKTARSDGQDLFEDDTRIYRRSLDFSVWFSEP
jgi:hypothetical protein